MQNEAKPASGGEEKIDVKQTSEREIWVVESRHYLGDDNILSVTVSGETDGETAIANKEADLKLANMVEGKVKILVDINRATKLSPMARKVLKELIEDEKFGKFAVIGSHPVARVLAFFGLGVTRKKDLRFFKTKEEALAWVKE